MASRVVYTAITGGHAQLTARPDVADTDFICYSDVPLDRDDWQIRPIEVPGQLSPRMQAKYHKLFPPSGYEWSVWIDGAYVLRTDEPSSRFVDDLISHSPGGLGLHRHHWWDCIFDEAAHAQTLPKCRGIPIEDQVRHYESAGHPKNWGLWAGGLLCRDDSARVREAMRRWWEEIVRWTWRDQLSLPFVMRSLSMRPDEWPWPLFHNPHMAGWNWNAV